MMGFGEEGKKFPQNFFPSSPITNQPLSGTEPCFFVRENGICASIIARNITLHPISSFEERCSFRKRDPAITANTDSKLISKLAVTGCRYFWAAICKVKATALEPMPQNSQNGMDEQIPSTAQDSRVIRETAAEKTAAVRNCRQESRIQSHFAA